MGFWDILLNENIYISALSSLENPGRYNDVEVFDQQLYQVSF